MQRSYLCRIAKRPPLRSEDVFASVIRTAWGEVVGILETVYDLEREPLGQHFIRWKNDCGAMRIMSTIPAWNKAYQLLSNSEHPFVRTNRGFMKGGHIPS